MWFPYSLPTSWKIECDRARAHDALADDQEREFLIGIQLRNPVSREWSVELQLQKPRWESHHDHSGGIIKVGYFPDENERLSEVACKLEDTNIRSAVDRSYQLVSDMLNFWSASYGRGFSIGGLRIGDLKHDARWRVLPHWPSAQTFELAKVAAVPKSLLAAANLYREGRTSTSDRYRFLCCEAILGKWKRGESPFGQRSVARELTQGHEQPPAETEPRVTQEIMVISGMHEIMPDLDGIKLSDLPERLGAWHAAAVEYVLNGNIEDEGRTGIDRASEWAAVANLVDLTAHQLLAEAIGDCTKKQEGADNEAYIEASTN
ncbi:MAG: hypothetical protein WD572_10825 [Gammaproteobacteria bacterium]